MYPDQYNLDIIFRHAILCLLAVIAPLCLCVNEARPPCGPCLWVLPQLHALLSKRVRYVHLFRTAVFELVWDIRYVPYVTYV